MRFIFEPEPRVTVPVADDHRLFPVRRVYCVGRNYAAHAREMGFDPAREPPFFFCKPDNAIVPVAAGSTTLLPYPSQTTEYHHEIELVVAIGKAGRDIPVERANEHVWGYSVGLDMTRRDLQLQLRDKGRPWELGKAFDHLGMLGSNIGSVPWPGCGEIGQDRQRSDIAKLIWSVPEIVANLSTYFELRPGDLIFTGTPEGVAGVHRGQTMHGGIDGLGELTVKVV